MGDMKSKNKMEVIDGGDIKMIKRKGKILVVRKLDSNVDKPVTNVKKKIIIHSDGIATTSRVNNEDEKHNSIKNETTISST